MIKDMGRELICMHKQAPHMKGPGCMERCKAQGNLSMETIGKVKYNQSGASYLDNHRPKVS